jgi:Prp8 binding protein
VKLFRGHTHNFENNLLKCSMSNSATRVSCGNADRTVNIWDYENEALKYKLPGHKGAVYEVDFHPLEPIVGSCGADKIIYLGEISPY